MVRHRGGRFDTEERGASAIMATTLPRCQATINSWFAYSGAIMSQTGIQLIAPSLPGMRDDLGLTDAQLTLIMTVYLLPAALGAIPAGILADRVGRRLVFGWSMVVFGLAGIALQLVTGSFAVFLTVRFIQGLAFAGLMPLTMTILGDAFRGSELIRSQGRRSVSMLVGDGILPIIGGFLTAIAWQAPWLGQLVAIPFGFAVLAKMTDPPSLEVTSRDRTGLAGFMKVFRVRGAIALQYAGFLRMFLKFSILTFIPVLLIDVRDLSPAFAGLVVGSAALIGIVPSVAAGRLARRGRPTTFVAIGLVGHAMSLTVVAVAPWPAAIYLAALALGVFDGMSGVFVNSITAAATDTEHRARFVAVTGAIRNLAKFIGPAFVGLLILVMTLPTAITVLAVITLLSSVLVIPLRSMDSRLDITSAEEELAINHHSSEHPS